MTRTLLLVCVLAGLLSVTAAAQNYNGYLDVADCNQIAGWSWDSTQPNTPINVDIYDGTTFVATVLASNFRQDLYNAGYGNGNHGYSFSTPASLKNNQYHYIYVKYGGTSLLLNKLGPTALLYRQFDRLPLLLFGYLPQHQLGSLDTEWHCFTWQRWTHKSNNQRHRKRDFKSSRARRQYPL